MTVMLDTVAEKAERISDYAIIVNPDDNVAVVKMRCPPVSRFRFRRETLVTIKQAVPPGHRFATTDIPAGRICPPIWPADRDIARDREGRMDHA